MRDVTEFNRAYPGNRIEMSSLLESIKQRRLREGRPGTYGIYTTPKTEKMVRRASRFANP